MIHILAGTDTVRRSARARALTGASEPVVIQASEASENLLMSYAASVSLFGASPAIIAENLLAESGMTLSKELLLALQESATIFILLEDKLLASAEKKYAKYASIERFDQKKAASAPKVNTFAIADAFGRGDKVGAWMLYREAVEAGIEPEAISGILFWKIKSLILSRSAVFSPESLKKQSSGLVSLYHRAHRGESDFVVGLEQFILSSLSR
jgi:DNA polymerase III delta subunit